jgi:hypothetical protein
MSPDLQKTLLGLVPAILSAILAYQVGRRHAKEDRRQRARELATALLVELRYVEKSFRDMYHQESPLSFYWYVPLPWFDKLFPDARYFSAETTQAAYEFYGLVLELQARRDAAAKMTEVRPEDHYAYRVKAAFTVERLACLVDALTREGGTLPPLVGVKQVTQGQLPELPPIIFPDLGAAFPEAVGVRPSSEK